MNKAVEVTPRMIIRLGKVLKKIKYNNRMRARTQGNHFAGKVPKVINPKPQERKPSTKINKGEAFKKKSNFDKKLVGKPVLRRGYRRINSDGTLELSQKQDVNVSKTPCKKPLNASRSWRKKHAN